MNGIRDRGLGVKRLYLQTFFDNPDLGAILTPFVNNANLGAIAQTEQWHLDLHCLPRKII